ncbi:hypothetical protein PR048_004526 [Dryococelus australis]|uniref:Uncharacterized protein n=1 Tax=Dryococelus australis TaxID=614101 RepID=A0ABQ9I5P7_9NEOP|nr:hypothetical protein PR048_004526 [Dryococelus australis]
MNKPEHKLIQDFETHWNSEYLMLERLLEQREHLSAELSSAKVDGFSYKKKTFILHYTYTYNKFFLFSCYVQFLKPVYDATEMVSVSYP